MTPMSDPGPMPGDPFPNPAESPVPSEQPPVDPIGIPQPGPDIIDPGVGDEPIGIPPGAPPEIPGSPNAPAVL